MTATLRSTLLVAAFAASGAASAAECTSDEYRQLDFWLGEWDVFETAAPRGPAVGYARVEAVAQGCALHEFYEQTDGLVGESLLSYVAARGAWQQTWITNRGSFMAIEGGLVDGRLVLEGEVPLKDGSTATQRITWQRQDDAVRESAELSKDGGRTWVPAFDVVFFKRATTR